MCRIHYATFKIYFFANDDVNSVTYRQRLNKLESFIFLRDNIKCISKLVAQMLILFSSLLITPQNGHTV